MLPRQLPESRESHGLAKIPQGEVGLVIALPLEGQDGVWASVNATINHPGKMNAEERKGRIRNRINQTLNQVPGLWRQLIVLAPERNDFGPGIHAAHSRHTVAMKAGAVDCKSSFKRSLIRLNQEIAGQRANSL